MSTFLVPDPKTGLTYKEGPPADCPHPNDLRAPISGDGWMCELCQQLVDAPSAEPAS